MTHVKHLGFELERKVAILVRVLSYVPTDQRRSVIECIKPVTVARAVADFYGIDL